ncbi:hypothetical protein [Rhizobium sp. MHM7A]|uniref:hypothetical protein n=1 Tax=Rhizobium sp. MHM7A TaxID=2583233 RepID=UPI0011068190|nr:hypothetical protein [Rhizobium sp. MHM7A]TLX15927.1 hypothetical protein FFR93_01020 [Rhizobium sp. MHM7A]
MSLAEINLKNAIDNLCENTAGYSADENPGTLITELGKMLGLLWLDGRFIHEKHVVVSVEASELDTFGAGFVAALRENGAHVKLSCIWSEFIPKKMISEPLDQKADYYVFAASNFSNMSAGSFVLSSLQAGAPNVSLACPARVDLQYGQFVSNCLAYASANLLLSDWLALPRIEIVGTKLETKFEETGVYDAAMKRCSAITEFFFQHRTSLYNHRWDSEVDQLSYENYIPELVAELTHPTTWHWKRPTKMDELRVKSSFAGAFR